MSLALNHYTIRTHDLIACCSFYENILGFISGPRPAFAFPGAWMYSGATDHYTNAVVHIIGTAPNDAASSTSASSKNSDTAALLQGSGAVDHIAFTATGLEEMLQHLTKLNVPFVERTVPGLGLHQVFLRDPLNIKIELNYQKAEKDALDKQV